MIGMVHSHVTVDEVEFSEIRYANTSLKNVEIFAMRGEIIGKLRMASIIVWTYPLMKTIPASERIMLLTTWGGSSPFCAFCLKATSRTEESFHQAQKENLRL